MVNNDSNKIITKYESVDLGLSSGNLWSTCNLGAVCPYESGDYFAWGELYPNISVPLKSGRDYINI